MSFLCRKGKRRVKGLTVRPVDLSDVVDLSEVDLQHPGIACHGVSSGMPPTAAAYSFAAHPGAVATAGRGLHVFNAPE